MLQDHRGASFASCMLAAYIAAACSETLHPLSQLKSTQPSTDHMLQCRCVHRHPGCSAPVCQQHCASRMSPSRHTRCCAAAPWGECTGRHAGIRMCCHSCHSQRMCHCMHKRGTAGQAHYIEGLPDQSRTQTSSRQHTAAPLCCATCKQQDGCAGDAGQTQAMHAKPTGHTCCFRLISTLRRLLAHAHMPTLGPCLRTCTGRLHVPAPAGPAAPERGSPLAAHSRQRSPQAASSDHPAHTVPPHLAADQ